MERVWAGLRRPKLLLTSLVLLCLVGSGFVALRNSVSLVDAFTSFRRSRERRAHPQHEAAAAAGTAIETAPRSVERIPQVIHQIVGLSLRHWRLPKRARDADPARLKLPWLSEEHRAAMMTWPRLNPGWQYRLWDWASVRALINESYPDLATTFKLRLGSSAERADLARYLVVHRHGGVFADLDVECLRPMDEVIGAGDRLVVGYEHVHDAAYARERTLRAALLGQGWFAATPGNPDLYAVAQAIRGLGRTRLFDSSVLNTVYRTGPGMFTGVLLPRALAAPGSVTVWPQVLAGLGPGPPGADPRRGPSAHRAAAHRTVPQWYAESTGEGDEFVHGKFFAGRDFDEGVVDLLATRSFESPGFSVLHYREGLGVPGDRVDVGRAMGVLGTPGLAEDLSAPSPALAAFFEAAGARPGADWVLDLGAGHGLVTLAAAARGLGALAYEAAPLAFRALAAGVAHNKAADRVDCVDAALRPESREGADLVCLSAESEPSAHGYERGRGGAVAAANATLCAASARLAALAEIDDRQMGLVLGGVHLNVFGWTGRLVRAIVPMLHEQRRPPLLVELRPWNETAEHRDRAEHAWLTDLQDAGYLIVRHWGPMCDARWREAGAALDGRGSANPYRLGTGGACHVARPDFEDVLRRLVDADAGEVFLLTTGVDEFA